MIIIDNPRKVMPSLVRVGWAVLSCFAFVGVIAYIAAAVIMPTKSEVM